MASAMPDLRWPSRPPGITALGLVRNFTVRWQTYTRANNLSEVATWKRSDRESNPRLFEPWVPHRPNHYTTRPHSSLYLTLTPTVTINSNPITLNRLHFVNLIPISQISTHLFLWLTTTLLSTHHSHHPPLHHSITSGLKLTFSTNPFHHSLLFSFSGLTSRTPWTVAVYFFVVFSPLTFYFSVPCGRLSWLMPAFERTLK